MTAADRLAAIRARADLIDPFPDVNPALRPRRRAWTDYHATRDDLRRMAAALDAVLALHKPMRIYDECDHPHQEGDPGVVDTGEFLTCEEEYRYSICHTCCVENPKWPEQSEWCASDHDHAEASCPTVAAITDALGGAE